MGDVRCLRVKSHCAIKAMAYCFCFSVLHWADSIVHAGAEQANTSKPGDAGTSLLMERWLACPVEVSELTRALGAHRWFVLKQGKIFWFKSDIITPVRCLASAHTGLDNPTLLFFLLYGMD